MSETLAIQNPFAVIEINRAVPAADARLSHGTLALAVQLSVPSPSLRMASEPAGDGLDPSIATTLKADGRVARRGG